MKNLLDKMSLKGKLIALVISPFLGFLFISILYINQILLDKSNNLAFATIFILIISCITIFIFIFITRDINDSIITIKSGLSRFFNYLTSTEKHLDSIDLNSKDYFGDMAKELNGNIQKIKDVFLLTLDS